MKTRQSVQDFMAMMSAEAAGMKKPEGITVPKISKELLPCKVCGTTDGTSRCARCRVVFYCGKEHQVADWASHKVLCKKNPVGLYK